MNDISDLHFSSRTVFLLTIFSSMISFLLSWVYSAYGLNYVIMIVAIPPIIIGFFLSLKNPFYTLILLIISTSVNIYGRLIEGSMYSLTVFHLSAILFIISFVINQLTTKKMSIKFPPVMIPILLLYLLMFISTSYSPNPQVALINFLRMFLLFILSILIFNIDISRNKLYIIFIVLFINILAISLYNLYEFSQIPVKQFLLEQLNPTHSITRTGANFDNINNFAILIATIIVSVFSIVFTSRISWIYKICLIILTVPIWISIATTFTRSVPMIISISLVIIYFFSPYRRFFHVLIILSVVLLAILYFNLGFVKIYLDRIVSMVLGNYDDSISTRGHLFRQGFKIGLDHFFWGIGLEGFPHYYVHRIPFTQLSWEIIASHNVLITLFVELGFMGPVLYLLIFYYYLKTHLQKIRSMPPSLFKALYFSSVLIVMMYFQFFLFNTPYFDENNFWIFWGISFLFWKLIQSEKITIAMEH